MNHFYWNSDVDYTSTLKQTNKQSLIQLTGQFQWDLTDYLNTVSSPRGSNYPSLSISRSNLTCGRPNFNSMWPRHLKETTLARLRPVNTRKVFLGIWPPTTMKWLFVGYFWPYLTPIVASVKVNDDQATFSLFSFHIIFRIENTPREWI